MHHGLLKQMIRHVLPLQAMFQQQPLQFGVMVSEILRKERVLLSTVQLFISLSGLNGTKKMHDPVLDPGEA